MKLPPDEIPMRTISGRLINLAELSPEDISMEEVAQALSRICRFTGHVENHYSVAQHSVLVSELLRCMGQSINVQLAGLLHDAAEAYIGDMHGPMKKLFPLYQELDRKITNTIRTHVLHTYIPDRIFLPTEDWDVIKEADKYAYYMEEYYVRHADKSIMVDNVPEYLIQMVEAVFPLGAQAARHQFNFTFTHLVTELKDSRGRNSSGE